MVQHATCAIGSDVPTSMEQVWGAVGEKGCSKWSLAPDCPADCTTVWGSQNLRLSDFWGRTGTRCANRRIGIQTNVCGHPQCNLDIMRRISARQGSRVMPKYVRRSYGFGDLELMLSGRTAASPSCMQAGLRCCPSSCRICSRRPRVNMAWSSAAHSMRNRKRIQFSFLTEARPNLAIDGLALLD